MSFAEKNARRKEFRDNNQANAARRLRRQYAGTFGDPKRCHPFNYNLMVQGTSKFADTRLDKEGDWA